MSAIFNGYIYFAIASLWLFMASRRLTVSDRFQLFTLL